MGVIHSKFRRTKGELIQKNICKTLNATWLTYTQTLHISFVD